MNNNFFRSDASLERPGKNEFEVVAQNNKPRFTGRIKRFQTDVVAMADLKLDVSKPPGPAAVGETVVYEISIRNPGTSAAENVGIIGLFSEGIDPTGVEGKSGLDTRWSSHLQANSHVAARSRGAIPDSCSCVPGRDAYLPRRSNLSRTRYKTRGGRNDTRFFEEDRLLGRCKSLLLLPSMVIA